MKQPLIFLAGATGTGKTALALRLADALDGGVVNFDSRQVYRDFPVITAQPTPEEQSRCPHLLYGFMPCHEKITAGAFVAMAREAIEQLAAGGKLPILVGGTGLYMRSLLQGLAPIPDIPEDISQNVLRRCREAGPQAMHEHLRHVDPDYASKIHPNDKQRVMRALEVFEATGRQLSWWHAQPVEEEKYEAIKLALGADMAWLKPRLAKRIGAMREAGALQEARRAWQLCPDSDAPAWSSIGCAELLAYLRDQLSLEEALELWLRNTRAYAKRQMTWFRKEEVRWLDAAALDSPLALDEVVKMVRKELR